MDGGAFVLQIGFGVRARGTVRQGRERLHFKASADFFKMSFAVVASLLN